MGIKQTYVSGCSFELCITDNSWAQSPADHCRSDALQCMQLLQCTCCPDGARSYTLPLQSSCHSDPVLSAPSQAYTSSSSSSSQNIKTCRQAKLIIQGHSSGRTRQLLRLPRQKLRLATGMLTGHSQLNRHLSVMGITTLWFKKNVPTLADYNYDPVQSILIIFSKLFANDHQSCVVVKFSTSPHICCHYTLWNTMLYFALITLLIARNAPTSDHHITSISVKEF